MNIGVHVSLNSFSLDICPGVGLMDHSGTLCVRAQSCAHTPLCPTLCNPVDCSPPGSSVHGIPQAGMLEWVASSFSRGSSQPRDPTHVSYISKWILDHWATLEAQYNSIFSILRNFHTIFHSGCTIYSPINSIGGFSFLHIISSIYYLFLNTVGYYFIVVLICISLIISKEACFHGPFGYQYVFFGEMSGSSAQFFWLCYLFFFSHRVVWAVYVFWKLSLVTSFVKIFSQSVGCPFVHL